MAKLNRTFSWNPSITAKQRQLKKQLLVQLQQEKNVDPDKTLLSVRNLDMNFNTPSGIVKALKNISFDVNEGDFYGIIGESGSGKTTVGRNIMRLYHPSGGNIFFDNKLVSQKRLSWLDHKWFHKNAQMIFQDPGTSINPVKTILSIVSEPLIINGIINLKTLNFIKNINQISKYFKFRYKERISKFALNQKLKFWQEISKINFEFQNYLNAVNLDDFTNLEDLLESFDEKIGQLNSDLKSRLSDIELIASEQKKFFQESKQKIENLEFEKIDKELHDILKDVKDAKYRMKNSDKSLNLRKQINQTHQEFFDFKEENAKVYDLDNKDLKNNILAKNKAAFLTSKQAAVLEKTNFLAHYVHQFEKTFYYQKHLLLVRFFRFRFLNQDEIMKINELISEALKLKFTSAYKALNLLRKDYESWPLNERVTKFLEFKKNYPIPKLRSWTKTLPCHYLIKHILKELPKAAEEVGNELVKYSKLHYEREKTFLETKKDHETKISTLSQALKSELRLCKDSANKYAIKYKKLYEELQLKKIGIIKRRIEIIIEANEDFKSSDKSADLKSEVKKTRQKNQKIDADNGKILYKLVRKKVYETLKKADWSKKYSEFYDSWVSVRAFQPKWNNRKVVKFQYQKVLRKTNLYSWLFNTQSWLTYLAFWFVRKNLLLDYVYDALASVGLKHEFAHRYPHEFSGGQRQRIVIARALITKPKLIVADEAISSLDVSIQSQVIKIMQNLAKEQGITFLFIAHDLSMVRYACNRLIIMHNGNIVEKGDVQEIFANPYHIYTQNLMKAIPELSAIDKNLADINDDDLNYAQEYNENNQPEFHFVPASKNHEVFATENQILRWNKR